MNEKRKLETDQERIAALARLIEEGQDRSYREWKKGVKRKAAVCIAEHLVRSGIKIEKGSHDQTREEAKGQ